VDLEHGEPVPHNVELELKPELELASLEMPVEHHAQELLANLDHVELQSSTAEWEHSEHGEHVQSAAEVELKPDLECASLVTPVELHAQELFQNQDRAELQSSTADGEHSEHGELVQSPAVWEHKHEAVLVSLVTLVELDVLELPRNHELVEPLQ